MYNVMVMGMLTCGKSDLTKWCVCWMDDSKRNQSQIQSVLGIAIEIPSVETIRQQIDDICNSLCSNLLGANVDMFVTHNIFHGELPGGEVPVDMDVTPFDNSKTMKEGVSRTYKGFDGYAPMVAYIGTEGFMANIELREVKRNSRKESKDGWLNELEDCCRRLQTVIKNLMLSASHLTKHARRLIMTLRCSNTWRHTFGVSGNGSPSRNLVTSASSPGRAVFGLPSCRIC